MKNKIKIAVISLCAVSSITVFCSQKSSGEGGYSHCLGLGDVDCPFSKTKVEYVMSGYSLEDLY